MADWIDACATYDIEEEVIRFDRDSRTFIIVRDHEDNYYCTDGMCTCLTGWWSKPPSNAPNIPRSST